MTNHDFYTWSKRSITNRINARLYLNIPPFWCTEVTQFGRHPSTPRMVSAHRWGEEVCQARYSFGMTGLLNFRPVVWVVRVRPVGPFGAVAPCFAYLLQSTISVEALKGKRKRKGGTSAGGYHQGIPLGYLPGSLGTLFGCQG